MAEPIRYIYGTEAQILALNPSNPNWFEQAFYYPTDEDINYFYQAFGQEMKRYGGGDGIGIKLNNKVIGGVKNYIEQDDVLEIPEYFDYNVFNLRVDGTINCNGQINIL